MNREQYPTHPTKHSATTKHSITKKLTSAVLSLSLIGGAFAGLGSLLPGAVPVAAAATTDYGLAETSQKGVILHCWNWSYNNIKKYMKDIAAAGFTAVQTSPVQQPKDYYWEGVAYGNVGIPNGTGGEDGNWWKAYQPVTFSICDNGHTWYGTKAEFKAMCAEAEKYGVKVIVDIVANHMGNIKGYKIGDVETVMGDISPQVGEFWNPDMLTDPSYWHISTSWTHSSDGRFDVTQGNMGMPDLNTGDSKVQQMVLGLLNECIDCGADGFRFDAAKHIETPADDKSFASNFWDVVLDGARAHYKEVNGYDGVYFYGEVLNRLDDTNAENYYLSKMSITDNSTSDNLRNSVINGSVSALSTSNYCGYIHGKGDHCVLWPESHDTYMGGGSSYDANDSDIKKTWAIIASRKDSTGLFFARPFYSKDILAGDVSKARQSSTTILANIDEQTQLGDVGTLTWADPAVVAVNRFRNFFVGQSEKLGSSGNNAYNVRGKTGIVIVRGGGPGSISISGTGMTDGTYTDQVSGETFTVSGGTVKGTVKNADGIAVVYKPTVDYGKVNPVEPTVIRISAETATGSNVFTTDNTTVTLKATGAASVSYSTTEGQSGTFTSATKTITVGDYTATGDVVGVTVKATASDGTSKEKSFQYTKKVVSSTYPTLNGGGVVFDNSKYNWSKVYCYAYNDSGTSVINNGAWPGVLMDEEINDYWTYEFPATLTGTVKVIFNDGSGLQFPGSGQAGLSMKNTEKMLCTGGALTELPESVATLSATLSASATTTVIGTPVKLTATAKDGSGTVKYTFLCNDGSTIQSASTNNTCSWTPSKEGTYILAVKVQDSSLSVTQTVTVKVLQSGNVLISKSSVSTNSLSIGDAVILKGAATGGTTPYQFAYLYRKTSSSNFTTLKDYSSTASLSYTPKEMGTYVFRIKVKDASGTVAEDDFTVIVNSSPVPAELTNTSTVSSTKLTLGDSVTVNCSATGGTEPYVYSVYYKKSTASSYTAAQTASTNSKVTIKPASAATYSILIRVKDGNSTVKSKSFQITVEKSNEFTNTTTLSASTITLGQSITVKCSATGGTSPYQYSVLYKKASSSSYTSAQTYSTNTKVTIKPSAATTYDIYVKAKDQNGTYKGKSFKVTVKKSTELTNTTTLSATKITLGKSVTVKCSATGGTSPYQYSVLYKKSSSSTYTSAQTYSTNASVVIKPGAATTYNIYIKAKDSAGTVKTKTLTLTVVK